MLSVSEAEKIIQAHLSIVAEQLGSEDVDYINLPQRVLAEDILAKRPQPPFDRVTMDGIAINCEDWNVKKPEFILQGTQFAGAKAKTLKPDHCIEVMTGAVLPKNANCVIPVELIEKTDQGFKIQDIFNSTKHIKNGLNIHNKGSDHAEDSTLIPAHTRLNATHIACLLSAGHTSAKVKKLPKISVLATGDELVAPGQSILDHQIYASNSESLNVLLQAHAQNPVSQYTVGDKLDELSSTLEKILKQSDIVITTGGVSMGQKDLLPAIFSELGVECHFHMVAQKPGKPLWFGSKNNTLVFALPGNPISSLVTARRYIIPALDTLLDLRKRPDYLILSEDVHFKPKLTYLLPVKVYDAEEAHYASPLPFNTSGDTVSLTKSDGFIELAAETDTFKAGDVVRYFPW